MNSQTRHVLHGIFGAVLKLSALIVLCFGILLTQTSFAASSNERVVIQGRIVDPLGVAVTDSNVNFDISIYTPTTGVAGSHCLLYRETQNGVDMTTSAGTFVLKIGDGSRVGSGPTLRETFTNASVASFAALTCGVGTAYTPGAIDDRSIEITVSFASQVLALAAIPVKAVPYAFQANQIGGYGINNLVRLNGAGSATNLNVDQFNYLTGFYHDNNTSGNYADDYLNAQSLQIKNVAAPTAANDAATKTYVDSAISGATATLPTINNAQIWVGNSSNVAVAVSMTGDGSIDNTGKLTVTGINGKAITGAPSSGQVLTYNGTAWVPTTSTSLSSTLTSQHIFVGNASNIAVDVAMTGDATISNAGALTLNTVPVTKGGTGVITYNMGEVPVYDGTKLTGMGCSVVGQVLQWQSGTGFVCTTLSGLSPVGSALTAGQVWVGNVSNIAVAKAPSGDVTMDNAGAFKVTQIQGTAVDATAPTTNQVLAYNGSKWIATAPASGGTTITGGTTKVLSMFNATGDNVIDSSVTDNGTSGVNFANSIITFGGNSFANLGQGTAETYVGVNAGAGGGATSSNNSGFGKNALAANTGNQNTAVGSQALSSNTTGSFNTAVGMNALISSTTGNGNTAIGEGAISASNSTGGYNTAVGISAMQSNSTGTYNTAMGVQALGNNYTGSYNIAVGSSAMSTANSGSYNTAIGNLAGLNANGTSLSNVFIGTGAGPASAGAISNKLYIDSNSTSGSDTPLIGGDFSTGVVQINSKLEMPLTSTTPTPSTGYGSVYAKADGQLYYKNASTEYQLSGVAAGGVTSVTATAPLAVDASTGAITASMDLASTHVYVGNGSGKAADVAMSGDASIDNTGKVTVTGLNGKAVTGTPSTNQILQYNGTAWTPITSTSLSSTLTNNHIFVGNSSNVASDVAMSGDATIAANGTLTLNTVPVTKGGTGVITYSAGQIPVYNGTGLAGMSCSTGQVLQWDLTNGFICSTLSAVSPVGSALTAGQIWVGNASNFAVAKAPSGDVTMDNTGAFTVAKLQGRAVASTAPTSNQVLTWNSTNSDWEPATASGGVTGGTTSYVTKWSSATAVTSSVIYDDGTNIGVGTITPVAMINAHGGAIVSDTKSNTSGVTNIVFSTGNVQTSANSTNNAAFKICGMQDGGSYSLVLTAQPVGSIPTFTAYSDAACSTAITNFDAGGIVLQTTTATTIITFIRAGSTVYAMLATGFTH